MAKSRKAKKPAKEGKGETLRTAMVALLIALFIRTFFVQAFRIPSGSMEDTLLIGDFLLVDKITFGARIPLTDWRFPGLRDPRRGDILVFKDPRTNRDYIKRCIAVGGETIQLRDNVVLINGKEIPEPYKVLKPVPGPTRKSFKPRRIHGKALFMMGDNRNNSQDSRYWGELDPKRVVGRAFVLYWSTDPDRAPRWVRTMSESWVKGLLQLVLGRPRLGRIGTWLARDYTDVYALGTEDEAREALAGKVKGASFGAAEAATGASGADSGGAPPSSPESREAPTGANRETTTAQAP